MSTEYYATKKILWREFKDRALPDELSWWRNPKLKNSDTYVGSIFDGEDYLYVWTGEHYPMQDNDPNIATFERYGQNEPSKILLRLGAMYDCQFVSDYGSVFVPYGEERWDEQIKEMAQIARYL